MDDYAESILAQQISQIGGVGLVSVSGQQKPAIRVQVDPARVAALGIGVEDIRTVLGGHVGQPAQGRHRQRRPELHAVGQRPVAEVQALERRRAGLALRHQFATLCVFLATVGLTAVLFVAIPKGFFPQQDTGYISGFAETSQDASFGAMVPRMLKLADIVRQDPDIAGFNASTGTGGANTGTFNLALKDKDDGRKASADEIIARLRPKLAGVEGVNLFLQAAQDVRIGGRAARTQYQYTLTDSDIDELNTWAPRLLARFKGMPELADVASDQQSNAAAAVLTIDRDRAASFGITPATIDSTLYDAVGQRQMAQY